MKQLNEGNWRCWRIDLAGVATLVALTAAGNAVLVSPILQAESQQTALISEVTAVREKFDEELSTIKKLEFQLSQLRQPGNIGAVQLQSSQRSNQRLAELTQIASQNGLQIDQVQAGTIESGSHYDIVPIRVNGVGSFQTFSSFLHRLHEDYPDTAVTKFDLSDNPSDPAAQASFKFDLKWYTAPGSPNRD